MKNKLVSILLFYIVAWCIAPPLSYGGIFRLLALGCVCLLCVMALYNNGGKIKISQIVIFVLMLYMLLISLIFDEAITYRLNVYIILAFVFMKDSIFGEEGNLKFSKWLISATFIMFIVFNITTLIELAQTPNIMRILAKNTENGPYYASRGVGGYGYMYTVIVFIPIGLNYLFDKNNSKLARILSLIFIVTSFVLTFQSQYFLAILLVIIIPVLFLVFRIKQDWLKYTTIILLVVAFILLLFNAEYILIAIMDSMSSTDAVYNKLSDIYDMIIGTAIDDTLFSTRLERYMRDINLILESPLWGHFTFTSVGKHSYILDLIAQYGVFVGLAVVFISLIYPIMNKSKKLFDFEKVLLLVTFIIALFNSLPFAVGSVMLILLPLYNINLNNGGLL